MSIRLRYRISESSHCVYIDQFEDVRRVLGQPERHWTVIFALALGAVLTAVYLWRRDLVANMIGHFMIDSISVLLPRFFSHT